MWNDDVTTTQLAAMEREHARLDTEWRAIGADLAAVTADAALAPLVPMVPRELRDAIEALSTTSPAAPPHAAHLIRA